MEPAAGSCSASVRLKPNPQQEFASLLAEAESTKPASSCGSDFSRTRFGLSHCGSDFSRTGLMEPAEELLALVRLKPNPQQNLLRHLAEVESIAESASPLSADVEPSGHLLLSALASR